MLRVLRTSSVTMGSSRSGTVTRGTESSQSARPTQTYVVGNVVAERGHGVERHRPGLGSVDCATILPTPTPEPKKRKSKSIVSSASCRQPEGMNGRFVATKTCHVIDRRPTAYALKNQDSVKATRFLLYLAMPEAVGAAPS